MSKKMLWIFLTLLTVVATLLTSCNSGSTTEEEQEEITVVTGIVTQTKAPETILPPDTTRSEKPQYGGTITIAQTTDPTSFDDVTVVHAYTLTLNLTNDVLLQGDWTKGPAGTGQATYTLGSINTMNLKTGALADSWEIPYKGKIVFHIREGVHWQNKPPTNGRLVTVEDIVFNLDRVVKTTGSYIMMTYPGFAKSAVITGDEATHSVTVECPPEEWAQLITLLPSYFSMFPKDALEQFGDMKNWKNSIGTGPFILTDFISAGSITFKRNPNFWETNPIGPGKGDQLPYVDNVKILIVPDNATYFAAFRVGKIDGAGGIYSDVKEFLADPDVKYSQYVSDGCYCMYMRTDKSELPFSKKEVRQALYYATDFQKIIKDYYEDHAILDGWPISPVKEFEGAFVPIEELPANVQDLFKYNPDKARELLAQAGYSTGFNVKAVCYNTPSTTDYLAQLVKMWGQVGITLTLDAKDYATWQTRFRNRTYDEMLYAYDAGTWIKMINFTGVSQYNASYINDEKCNEAMARSLTYIGIDEEALYANNKELMPYVIEQCWVVPTPTAYSYVVWWPWVKNWNGELYVGYYSYPSYMKYRWEDEALKKQMTGR
jgi:peptide/nickel transport system substrate-binding protein